MRNRRLLASLGVTAALAAGGLVWLGAPGVSGAQTSDTTTPPTTAAPAPGAPDDGQAPAPGERGRRNCPEKDAESGAQGSSARSTGRFVRL